MEINGSTAKFDNALFSNINNPNNILTNDNLSDIFDNSCAVIDDNKNDEKINEFNIPIGIYRYKFTNHFTNELYKFSKVHQYDHRKDFKEAWEIWIVDNCDLVDGEIRRLTNIGYDGDILDKMFKSARYYFRKKSTEKKTPIKRRVYLGSQKDLLEVMDQHIKSNISSGEFKPSDGFDDFCKKNVDILKDQVSMLIHAGLTDSNEIKLKIKKTYKNRYFLIITK
jgi:hypothetical protein